VEGIGRDLPISFCFDSFRQFVKRRDRRRGHSTLERKGKGGKEKGEKKGRRRKSFPIAFDCLSNYLKDSANRRPGIKERGGGEDIKKERSAPAILTLQVLKTTISTKPFCGRRRIDRLRKKGKEEKRRVWIRGVKTRFFFI